jgi:hypothetical protein
VGAKAESQTRLADFALLRELERDSRRGSTRVDLEHGSPEKMGETSV